jgi:hypothetical protein
MKKTVHLDSLTFPALCMGFFALQIIFIALLAAFRPPSPSCCYFKLPQFLYWSIKIALYSPILPIALTVICLRLGKSNWNTLLHWTIWALLFVGAFLSLFINVRRRIPDLSACMAGKHARYTQEVWYNENGGDISGGYTDQLSDLLSFDKNLTDDEGVTFIFGQCNATGYTFTTVHKDCDCKQSWFVFTDADPKKINPCRGIR